MTNILTMLIPKAKVDYLYSDFTIRQSLEKMYAHSYGTIPVIDRKTGKYIRSVNQGDFLSYILVNKIDFNKFERLPLDEIKESRVIKPVYSTANINDLTETILNQNYVPVVDDNDVFIGIVTRSSVMSKYLNIK